MVLGLKRKVHSMQAIITRYHGPTNFKGSRYSARCSRGRITVSAQCELNSEQNHKAAAAALVARFVKEDAERYGTRENPWARPLISGELPDGSMAHVSPDEALASEDIPTTIPGGAA